MINNRRLFGKRSYKNIAVLVIFYLASINQIFAAELIDEVSAEALNLLFYSRLQEKDTGFYSTIPESFPTVEIPSDFELRAAYDGSGSIAVVFETSFSQSEAIETLVAAFIAAGGWSKYEYPMPEPQGFATVLQSDTVNLCHDSLPAVRIEPIERESSIFLRISTSHPGNHRTCAEVMIQIAQSLELMTGSPDAVMGLGDYLPVLVIPGDMLEGVGYGSGGGSGSRFADATFSAKINLSLSELNEHFAQQLRDQGWVFEGDWVGETAAGGAWILDKEVNTPIFGIMTILEKPNDSYDLYFRLMQ